MNCSENPNSFFWYVALVLITIWGIGRIEYALRPEGVKTRIVSVDTSIER